MKTEATPEQPVIFNGEGFYGIKQFDCRVIELYNEKTLSGTMFTCVAISPKSYRDKSPTKARVVIEVSEDWTAFCIYNDHGGGNVVRIHNSLSTEIEHARASAIKKGLLKKTK